MKADLEYWRSLCFWGLAIAGGIVMLGVGCEYSEVSHDFREWLSGHLWYRTFFPKYSEPRKKRTWIPFWATVGFVLIVAGLAGEVAEETALFNADNQISVFDEKVLKETGREAEDAKDSAKGAHAEFNAVDAESKENAKEIAEGLREARQIRDMLGPRYQLLERNKDAFIKTLKPFAPQRIFLVSCGLEGQAASEAYLLQEYLTIFLGSGGAGWTVDGYSATWSDCVGTTNGDPPTSPVALCYSSVSQQALTRSTRQRSRQTS